MIKIEINDNPSRNAGEDFLRRELNDERGLMLVGIEVTGARRRTREIDTVWVAPEGLVTIEVKGTHQVGVLTPYRGTWMVGDQPLMTSGKPTDPGTQALEQSKVLASLLKEAGLSRGFIKPVAVVVSGRGSLTIAPGKAESLANVVAADADTFLTAARAARVGRYSASEVLTLLDALQVSPVKRPTIEQLHAEGFPDTVATTPTQRASVASVRQYDRPVETQDQRRSRLAHEAQELAEQQRARAEEQARLEAAYAAGEPARLEAEARMVQRRQWQDERGSLRLNLRSAESHLRAVVSCTPKLTLPMVTMAVIGLLMAVGAVVFMLTFFLATSGGMDVPAALLNGVGLLVVVPMLASGMYRMYGGERQGPIKSVRAVLQRKRSRSERIRVESDISAMQTRLAELDGLLTR